MKKFQLSLLVLLFTMLYVSAQPVTDYTYVLANGINIRSENCWNQVWVQQSYTPLAKDDQNPLTVSMRALGDIISASTLSFRLQSAGKEVKLQGAAPGTYDLKLSFQLSGAKGTLGFMIKNVLIKAGNKTNVGVTLYDYQFTVGESKATLGGKSSFEIVVDRCKSHGPGDTYTSVTAFYMKGNHDKPVASELNSAKTGGKINPGTYDMLLTISIAGQEQKIWFENLSLKPDMNYKIGTNLNAGGIVYTGVEKSVRALYLYPAGTAAAQTGTPGPVKNIKPLTYNDVRNANCVSPGSYDVLIDFKNGTKYEWRKNIAIVTGSKAEIK